MVKLAGEEVPLVYNDVDDGYACEAKKRLRVSSRRYSIASKAPIIYNRAFKVALEYID